MGSLVIVEPEVGAQLPLGFPGVGISFQVHLLVLHRPQQPLHEYVVGVPPLPIHADPRFMVPEHLGELHAGELTATVGVEYLGPAQAQRLLQRLDAEIRLQGIGALHPSG